MGLRVDKVKNRMRKHKTIDSSNYCPKIQKLACLQYSIIDFGFSKQEFVVFPCKNEGK